MKQLLKVFILIAISVNVYGTPQSPDRLIYEGDTVMITSHPLEAYFTNDTRPNDVFEKYGYSSTACHRGYIGYWELKNDSLYLVKLKGHNSDIDLSLIFKNTDGISKIHAEWLNGSLFNPYGKKITQLHNEIGAIYEDELEFIFKDGILDEIKEHDNSKSKKSEFHQDPMLLKKFIRKNIDYNNLSDKPSEKVKVFVKIAKVSSQGEIEEAVVVKGYNEEFDNEALRVVKQIPYWDVLYQHGEQIQVTWIIPVVFNKVRK